MKSRVRNITLFILPLSPPCWWSRFTLFPPCLIGPSLCASLLCLPVCPPYLSYILVRPRPLFRGHPFAPSRPCAFGPQPFPCSSTLPCFPWPLPLRLPPSSPFLSSTPILHPSCGFGLRSSPLPYLPPAPPPLHSFPLSCLPVLLLPLLTFLLCPTVMRLFASLYCFLCCSLVLSPSISSLSPHSAPPLRPFPRPFTFPHLLTHSVCLFARCPCPLRLRVSPPLLCCPPYCSWTVALSLLCPAQPPHVALSPP